MKQSSRGPSKPKITKEERRAKYTELARRRSSKERERAAGRTSSVCFQCRRRGHSVANCPNTSHHVVAADAAARCCYRCGSTEHSLSSCPKRRRGGDGGGDDGGGEVLPFATCFVCQEVGHLASQCPNNSNGIYIHGGCCKVCGSKQHRGTECPEKRRRKATPQGTEGGDAESGGETYDNDDLLDDDESWPHQGIARNPEASASDGAARGGAAKAKRRIVDF